MYDGQSVVEHGFNVYPENVAQNTLVSSGGGIGIGASMATTNQIQYSALYEWTDNQGQIHRSAPSVPLIVQLPANATITPKTVVGTTTVGSKRIVGAYSPTDLYVGQVIVDQTNPTTFVAGTYITGFDLTAGDIFVSTEATAAHVGDTFATFDVNTITIRVPTLRQTDKQNVSIVLYRTENNGTIFYRVTSASRTSTSNGLIFNNKTVDFVTISDVLPDAAIIGNQQLYTTGGVVENIAAPAISALATFKNRMVYLSPESPYQWGFSQQVLPGLPVEFNSEEFVQNVDQQIGQLQGVKPLDDKLIFYGPISKWYVVGQGPSPIGTNNDFTDATRIQGVTGCSNPDSIIEIPNGLMYQDRIRGIYLLDRALNEQYIGSDVESYNAIKINSAQKFESQTKAVFTLANGVNLLYDWYVNQWETDPFAVAAEDSTIFQKKLTYIQANGLILQQTPGVYSDNGAVIPIELESGWISFAGLEGFQRVWEFQLMGTYHSPHTLTLTFYTDFSNVASQTVVIPVLSNPANGYKFRIGMKVQKCTSIKFKIEESQASPGQGFSLSSVAFRVASKKGLNKLAARESF